MMRPSDVYGHPGKVAATIRTTFFSARSRSSWPCSSRACPPARRRQRTARLPGHGWPTASAGPPRARRRAGWRSRPSPSNFSPQHARPATAASSGDDHEFYDSLQEGARHAHAGAALRRGEEDSHSTATTLTQWCLAARVPAGGGDSAPTRGSDLTHFTRDQTMAQDGGRWGHDRGGGGLHPARAHAVELDRRPPDAPASPALTYVGQRAPAVQRRADAPRLRHPARCSVG